MPITTLDEVLDASTLTWWELVVAGLILVVALLAERLVRRKVRSWLQASGEVAPHLPEPIVLLSGGVVMLVGILFSKRMCLIWCRGLLC